MATTILILSLLTSCRPIPEMGPIYTNEGLSSPDAGPADEGPLEIIAIDVGEGDSTLIMTPNGTTILIDGGRPEMGYSRILPLLEEKKIDHLDYIFVSHYDEDHIGGVPEVIKGKDGTFGTKDDLIPTYGVWDRGEDPTNHLPSTEEYLNVTGGLRNTVIPGETWKLGEDLFLTSLTVNGEILSGEKISIDQEDENGKSIGLILKFRKFKYFTGGDLPGGGGDPPYETIDLETPIAAFVGDIDVLHISHHGSKTSTNEFFLETLKPEAAIISVGDGNDYWHPHESVIERLLDVGVKIYQTEKGFVDERDGIKIINGNILIESDGESYDIN